MTMIRKLFIILLSVSTGFALWSADLSDNERMEALGMVDVIDVAPDVLVSLMYAGPDNFTGAPLYGTLTKAYLRPEAAKSVAAAQSRLSELKPGYRLKIYDAARPMNAQKRMYNKVRGTSKARYVSNPANGGGLHNYGMAVDVTIVDDEGNELDMGTAIDYMGREAHIDNEEALVRNGKLTAGQVENRRLLRRVMRSAGFTTINSEWWHFNRCSRSYARNHYKVID